MVGLKRLTVNRPPGLGRGSDRKGSGSIRIDAQRKILSPGRQSNRLPRYDRGSDQKGGDSVRSIARGSADFKTGRKIGRNDWNFTRASFHDLAGQQRGREHSTFCGVLPPQNPQSGEVPLFRRQQQQQQLAGGLSCLLGIRSSTRQVPIGPAESGRGQGGDTRSCEESSLVEAAKMSTAPTRT